MKNYTNEQPLANHHVSVDCVVFGFDGEQLNALLIRRNGVENGKEFHDMKLPGSLIYKDEDLDDAAKRVLHELTGLQNVNLRQFKAFGSNGRTKDPKDVHWLERATREHIDRIITISYVSLVKLNRTLEKSMDSSRSVWIPICDIPALAFDHNIIIQDSLVYIRNYLKIYPAMLFELLSRKFTAAQLRILYEEVSGKKIDIRNFHKKISMMKYVVPLDEYEKNVAHRAARYYKFDREKYKKANY